jgi:hypothetical protein
MTYKVLLGRPDAIEKSLNDLRTPTTFCNIEAAIPYQADKIIIIVGIMDTVSSNLPEEELNIIKDQLDEPSTIHPTTSTSPSNSPNPNIQDVAPLSPTNPNLSRSNPTPSNPSPLTNNPTSSPRNVKGEK